jgi:hypothetical protein
LLAITLQLNTVLFLNSLDGMSEEKATERVNGRGNSVSFLAAHMIDARHFIATMLGSPLANPIGNALSNVQNIEDAPAIPALPILTSEWIAVSSHLYHILEGPIPVDLSQPAPHPFPISDSSILGGIAFLVQHDSFHLGQIAFLRRQLGYEAMSYSQRPPTLSAGVGA